MERAPREGRPFFFEMCEKRRIFVSCLRKRCSHVSATMPRPWLSWDRGNIALSAAMRKDGRLILRFYEFCGRKTAVTLSGSWVDGKTIREITPEGDFLKDVPARCADFAPFEIKTLAVET